MSTAGWARRDGRSVGQGRIFVEGGLERGRKGPPGEANTPPSSRVWAAFSARYTNPKSALPRGRLRRPRSPSRS